jgi:protein SCO1/2
VVIVEFGYTFCALVCPVTLARLTEVHQRLGSAARDVQLIYVTVDPLRDNPERLREHLAAFNPSFLGATGSADELAAVQKAYGVVAEQVVSRNKALGYEVNHSSSLYLVDRQGKIRGLAPFGTPADDIVHDLELLLKMRP